MDGGRKLDDASAPISYMCPANRLNKDVNPSTPA